MREITLNQHITIERANKPLAKIVPAHAKTEQPQDKLDLRDALGLTAADWTKVDATEWVAQARTTWH